MSVYYLFITHFSWWLWISFPSTSIRLLYEDEVLPRAMTCGNMLQLPSYSSKEPEFLGNIRQIRQWQHARTGHNCTYMKLYEHMIIWLWYTAWTWNRWINYNISAIGSQLAVASCQHCGKKWMPPCLQYKNTPLQRSNCNFSFWRLVTWGCQCSWCRQEQCRWRFAGSEKVPQRCL